MAIDDINAAGGVQSTTVVVYYYKTSIHCPRANKEGKTVLYKVMLDDDPVWVMHPSLLGCVKMAAQREGLHLVEFDIDAFLRRQCANLALEYLDGAIRSLGG